MGKHARTAPLLSTSPPGAVQPARPNLGYLDHLESGEAQRVRQDAFDDHFAQGRTRFISFAEGQDRAREPGSPQALADRASVSRALSKTSVPPEHLNGVQFLRVVPGMLDETTMAQYHPRHRGMDVPDVRHPDPWMRNQQVRSVVHEIGHHVENMTNGRISSLGRSEAMAENYADRHLPKAPVTHSDVTLNYRPRSGYDTRIHDQDAWQQDWDPSGEVNRKRYVKTRAKGTLPHEY